MTQYIPKKPLLEEIEKRKLATMDEHMAFYSNEAKREYNTMCELIAEIESIEVKDVDLEKEIDSYIETFLTGTNPIYTKGGVSCIIDKAAKHFFELGMVVGNKAQKGE